MKLSGRYVIIKCDDRAMREYNTTVSDDGKFITCYIASQPGEEFSIEYSCSLNYAPPDVELVADVYLGGAFDGGWIAPDPSPGAKKVTGDIWGSRRGNKCYKYAFSKPEVIDGETPSSTDLDHIGEIMVGLGFVERSEQIEEDTASYVLNAGPTRVNEKDKKPGVHCAGPVLDGSPGECTEPVLRGTRSHESTLFFTFQCRAEEWLKAKGFIRKRRRRRGEPEPVEDPEVKPLPKPEPVEEAVYANDALMGGVEASSTTGPLPSPRSPTPLSYADDKPVVQGGKEMRPTPRATEQEQPRPAPPNSIVLERPRKVPRRSGSLRLTIKDETQLAAIGTHSIHDRSHVQEDYSGSKVKVEEGSSVPKVKKEEGNSAQKIKKEEGSSAQKIKEEVGVNKFSDLKAEEKELEEQIAELERKRNNLRREMATFKAPRIKTEARSPRPKVKTERESTRLPMTPEINDLV